MKACDQDIYKNGQVVMWLDGRSIVVEAIVQAASERSGIPIDWHYIGGRACVKTLGDIAKAHSAIESCLPTILDT